MTALIFYLHEHQKDVQFFPVLLNKVQPDWSIEVHLVRSNQSQYYLPLLREWHNIVTIQVLTDNSS